MTDQLIVDMKHSGGFKDYNSKRDSIKNGLFFTFLILFKSTFGVGVLANQMYFFTTGYVLGPLLIFIITGLITYSTILVSYVSDEIEKEHENPNIENLDDLAYFTFQSTTVQNAFYVVIKLFVFAFNYGACLINAVNMAKFFLYLSKENPEYGFSQDLNFYKIIVFLIILALVFLIILPENLKYPGIFGTVVMLGIISYFIVRNFMSGNLLFPKTEPIIFEGIPSFIGNQLYSFESIGGLLTIRSTMKEKHKMKYLLCVSGIFIALIFSLLGLSFYLNFESPQNMVFFYFPKDSTVQFLEIVFYISCPTRIIMMLVSNFLMLEDINVIKRMLTSPVDNFSIDYYKVMIFRLFSASVLCSFMFFGKLVNLLDINEYSLIIFNGLVVVPVIGFIYPVSLIRLLSPTNTLNISILRIPML